MTVRASVALSAFAVLATTVIADTVPVGVTLVKVNAHDHAQYFELKNGGAEAFEYAHWFMSGPEPVAYCRAKTNEVRLCVAKATVNEDGTPAVHEYFLAPGKSVRFAAYPTDGEVVGVKYWVHGSESFIWGAPES